MRAVIQRVSAAHVEVAGNVVGRIERGLLVLLGVEQGDSEADLAYLVEKTAGLRIFEDEAGKMNLDLAQVGGSVLAVSQFTLLADCRKGRRPGFSDAAPPQQANDIYQQYMTALKERGLQVASGVFQADMQVHLVNDGPVTILLDSRKRI
ncbi:MAG: D-tyrosyl-tRNA(Tyr) deacylase [Desulfuromonas sp.]|nr:MAG: D-tyrosyl-tRNA(Tyr) deacylase [Desulfuromonas sp.]